MSGFRLDLVFEAPTLSAGPVLRRAGQGRDALRGGPGREPAARRRRRSRRGRLTVDERRQARSPDRPGLGGSDAGRVGRGWLFTRQGRAGRGRRDHDGERARRLEGRARPLRARPGDGPPDDRSSSRRIPRPVRDAIEKHRAEFDRNPAVYLRQTEPGVEEAARQAAADYLESAPEQVALTDSTTMGLGLVYSSLRLEEGDEVVTTEHDFYSTHESLRLRAERDGATVQAPSALRQPGRRLGRPDRLGRARRPRPEDALPRDHLGPLRDGREAAGARDRRRGRRGQRRPRRGGDDPARRRRRPRLRQPGRLAGGSRRRHPRVRLPQVALRPARHRLRLGAARPRGRACIRRSRRSTPPRSSAGSASEPIRDSPAR